MLKAIINHNLRILKKCLNASSIEVFMHKYIIVYILFIESRFVCRCLCVVEKMMQKEE
jgi:hypothetical protein